MIDWFLISRSDKFPDSFMLATRTFKVTAEKGNEKQSTHIRHHDGQAARVNICLYGRVEAAPARLLMYARARQICDSMQEVLSRNLIWRNSLHHCYRLNVLSNYSL